MQKKVLIPLLMTGPMAFPALADINMNFPIDGDWKQQGTTGNENTWSASTNADNVTSISCVVGTGYVTTTLQGSNYPKGNYKILFQSAPVNIKVYVGGKEITIANNEGSFELNGENTEVRIEAADKAKGFSFEGKRIVLVFNSYDTVKNLQNQLAAIEQLGLDDVNADDDFQQATDLKNRKATLQNDLINYSTGESFSDVWANIKKIGGTSSLSQAEQVALYKKYGLDNTPSSIKEYLDELEKNVKAYNADVKAENAIWDLYLQNVTTRNDLISGATTLQTNLTNLINDVNAWKVVDDAIKAPLLVEAQGIQSVISKYLEGINEAYPDPKGKERAKLRENITFNPTPDAGTIQTEIDNLSAKFSQKQKDYQVYYNVNFTLMADLKAAYDNFMTKVAEAKGVAGYEDVYADIITEAEKKATALYNTTKDKNQIKEVDGAEAADLANGYSTNITKAINTFNSELEAFNDLVETQNANMTTAQSVINGFSETLKKLEETKVPQSQTYQADFDKQVKAIREALKDINDYVNGEYEAHKLDVASGSDFDTKKTNIQKLLDDLEDFVKPFAVINNLQAELDKAKEDVAKISSNEKLKGVVDINNKFQGTFQALQDAINALTPTTAADATVTGNISTEIGMSVTNAQDMSDAFVTAIETINGYETDLNALKAFVEAKEIDYVEAVKALKEAFDFDTFQKQIDKLNADLTAAGAAERQTSWQLIQALNTTLKATTIEADMNTAKITFAENATDANMAYANSVYNTLDAKLQKAKDDGITHADAIVLTDISATLHDIESNVIPAAKNSSDIPGELAKADQQIIDALNTLDQINTKLENLIQNQKSYDSLASTLNALQQELDKVSAYNDETSLEPGLDWYKDNVIPAIQSEITSLLSTELPASLQAETVVKDMQGEKGYSARVQTLLQNILQTRYDIETNNTYHNGQLAFEKDVRNYIEGLLTEINDNQNAAGLTEVKNWVNTLQSLINNDIVNENINVTLAYGKGESKAQNSEIMAEYQRIYDAATKIDIDYHGDAFHEAVVAANAITTGNWNQYMSDLDDQYRAGIRQYNYFFYELENQGWKEYVLPRLERHAILFQYYEKILELKNAEDAQVKLWNKENHVITEAEWNVWVAKYTSMNSDILKDVRDLLDHMNVCATEYFDIKDTECKNAIADAKTKLVDAGIPTTYLNGTQTILNDATKLYNDALNNTDEEVSLQMDNIADELDKVIPSIKLQEWAQTQWGVEYSDAQSIIAKLREDIKSYEFAKEEVVKAFKERFNEDVEQITVLNTTVTGIQKDLIDTFAKYSDDLDALIANLRGYAAEIKKSNDLNKEDLELWNKFQDVQAPALDTAYNALKEYCDAMGGCSGMQSTLDQIANTIEDLKTLVNSHKGALSTLGIQDRCDNIDAAITAAYVTAANAEKTYLLKLVKNTKVAFNDAYEHNAVLPEPNTYDTVDAQITFDANGIDQLIYVASKKEDFKNDAVSFEKDLCRIYVMLQSSWTNNPAADIVKDLNGRYDEISAEIADAEAKLDTCLQTVKDKYPNAYADLTKQLNDEKAAWTAEGDMVVAREAYHVRNLNEIEAAVNALEAEIAQAQADAFAQAEKERISNERYDVLKAEYDNLVDEFEAVKTLVYGYENGVAERYQHLEDRISSELAAALEELETAKANFSLTANSELSNAATISAEIDNYKLSATRTYTRIMLNNTNDAKVEASSRLATLSIVPADREALQAEFNVANAELQDLLDEFYRADFDRLNAIVEAANRLTEKFNEIARGAEENSFVLGNVNMDPDGEVNVLDVQELINMVGEGVTYSELYNENPRQACAADVAGNEEINVADVTALIQMIIGDDVQVVRARAHMKALESDDSLQIILVGEENGVRRYAIALNNSTAFIGGQLDIKLSGNARVVEVAAAGERAADHDAYVFENAQGVRVVMASMTNSAFEGNDGAVMYVDVEGNGDLTVQEAIFSDRNNVAHRLNKSHTSKIDAIIDGVKDRMEGIYDLTGRGYKKLQRGINIIIRKDGSVSKEMHK
ncbi:MAG: hypothetical protein NC328_06990 [Muribaculum sp.]|nr:hypothetical protein [Muribaculum sp.]